MDLLCCMLGGGVAIEITVILDVVTGNYRARLSTVVHLPC